MGVYLNIKVSREYLGTKVLRKNLGAKVPKEYYLDAETLIERENVTWCKGAKRDKKLVKKVKDI